MNRIARATVDMTREISKGAIVSISKSTSSWNLEGEVTTQNEILLRDCGRFAIKSNRIVTKEGSEGDHESMANMTLPENKQAQHEKELS